jgi:hypothetical protein
MRHYQEKRAADLIKKLKFVASTGKTKGRGGHKVKITITDVKEMSLEAAVTIEEILEANHRLKMANILLSEKLKDKKKGDKKNV